MPFEPLRYIHAANLNLDSPLASIGECDQTIREIVQEATFDSYRNIVALCIEHHVDFLLLAGNCFVESACSLQARLGLLDGFERLEEAGIRVFVLPGDSDPPAAWRAIPRLGDNITVFYETSDAPVAVIRDERVIATVTADHIVRFLATEESQAQIPATHWSVGLPLFNADDQTLLHRKLNVDFLALGGRRHRDSRLVEAGLIHHPGSAQPLSADEFGPHGCTLVEVDPDRHVQTSFLSTAPIRWERVAVAVTDDMSAGELLELMQEEIQHSPPAAGERVRIVTWLLRGRGAVLVSLRNGDAIQRLSETLERPLFPESGVQWIMRFRIVSDDFDIENREATSGSVAPLFAAELSSMDRDAPQLLRADIADAFSDDESLRQFVSNLADECDTEVVTEHARSLGREWLDHPGTEGRAA